MDHDLTGFLAWLAEHNPHGRMRVEHVTQTVTRFVCGGRQCTGVAYYIRTVDDER